MNQARWGNHSCDLTHDCATTKVNHLCSCGAEYPALSVVPASAAPQEHQETP